MSFTFEELTAAGMVMRFDQAELFNAEFVESVWGEYLLKRGSRHPYEREQECALRLALAHPERAAMALGDGWSVAQWTDDGESTFTVIRWSRDLPEWWMLHVYPHGGVRIAEFGDLDIPQEFREALARADLISAAWQRIATQEATA